MKILWLLLFVKAANAGWLKDVKYMPMGYDKKPNCPEVPEKKPSGGFDVWMFLATLALTSNIAANIVNNANSNNNNNNNNDNQDNQNTLNFNMNMNMNENMNMNMLAMAMGRALNQSHVCQVLGENIHIPDGPHFDKIIRTFGFYSLMDTLSC